MVRDGFYFLVPLVAAALAAFWLGWTPAAAILLGLAGFVAFFFRDPPRSVPEEADLIVSPADGRVVRIREGARPEISIFLSLFDVHVNRAPASGRVADVRYRAGRFMAAFRDEASLENERNTLTIEHDGATLECTQIAGVVARRIVCWKRPGDMLQRGERIGLIRFGSRVDLVLPPGSELKIKMGDRVRGGSSPIARVRPSG